MLGVAWHKFGRTGILFETYPPQLVLRALNTYRDRGKRTPHHRGESATRHLSKDREGKTMRRILYSCLISMFLITSPASIASAEKGGPSKKQLKALICHLSDEDGAFTLISVAEPAVPAHLRHGDRFSPTGDCSNCFNVDTSSSSNYYNSCMNSCNNEGACTAALNICPEDSPFKSLGACGFYVKSYPCLCSD